MHLTHHGDTTSGVGSARHRIKDLASAALDLLLPPRCAACGGVLDSRSPLCAVCATTLDVLQDPCPRCACPAARPCPTCSRHPPPFIAAWAPFTYAGALATAVARLKYYGMAHVARPLGQLLRSAVGATFADASPLRTTCIALDPTRWDAIVPVPLHRRRLTERGYNQALLLARATIRGCDLRLAPWRALRRIRATAPQPGRDRHARQMNVRGAFAADPLAVRGLRLLLVDDVLTTGATAAACSEALLAAGAAAVGVLALARAE